MNMGGMSFKSARVELIVSLFHDDVFQPSFVPIFLYLHWS
ncbi:hypothetical protein AVDCRST_MAG81-4657 [uncultured Synechococcales cyanobacterium]|uniref:Uncharacterized protein n=1 Tax=uncultured Synechococcales cyanobacterium TaxID=1936017 RepID=A0A6J4VY35_9CYAN|nr:hypothetical protein AVDCRST_MAG81-4657 [uncultured Synechococcales cyanobacterium]